MTMHMEDALPERAISLAGVGIGISAVDFESRDSVRRGAFVTELAVGLSKSATELKTIFDPAYNLAAMRLAQTPTLYGRTSRSCS